MGNRSHLGRLVHLKPYEAALSVQSTHCVTYNHVHHAYQEHQERNLIDAVHHTQVYVLFFLLSEQVQRIHVVEDFLEKHGTVICGFNQ